MVSGREVEAGAAWPGGQIFPPADHLRVSQGLGSLLSSPGPLVSTASFDCLHQRAQLLPCLETVPLVTYVFLLFYAVGLTIRHLPGFRGWQEISSV